MFQYISPLDKARRFLSNYSIEPEDNEFITQSKQNGYGEDFYLPAIASKKMRAEDVELQEKYQQYKSSPTTFMSNFKSEYGKEDRGKVGDTIGFLQNLFVDVGENVEELGKAVASPIDTLKGLGGLASKEGMKAIWGAIKENFGTWEKAKETFYENPFDVLSVLIPVAKVGKVGTLGKAGANLSGLSDLSKAAMATKAGGKVASFAGKHAQLINNLADLTNWDINLMKGAAKTAGGAVGLGKSLLSSMAYGTKGQNTLGNLLEATQNPLRREAIKGFRGMSEPQIAGKAESAIEQARTMAKTDLDKGVQQSAELGTYPVPEKFIQEGKLTIPGEDALYKRGGNLETEFKLGGIKDVSKGKLIKVAEAGMEQSDEALKAEEIINNSMKKFGLDKKWYDMFDPKKTQNVLDNLQEAIGGKLENVRLAPKTADIVKQYMKWTKEAQNKAYPLIKRAREGFKEFSEFADDLAKELPTGARTQTYINRLKNLGGNETMKKAVQYINSKTGVNLEDMATALMSEKVLGPGAKSVLGGGAVGSFYNPLFAIGALGYTVATSPAALYKLASWTGPIRGGLKKGGQIISQIAKKIGVSEGDLASALEKVRKSPDGKAYMQLIKQLGEGVINRKTAAFLERVNREVSTQYGEQSEERKRDIYDMNEQVKRVSEQYSTPPQDSNQVPLEQEYESQLSQPLEEGQYINPEYLN